MSRKILPLLLVIVVIAALIVLYRRLTPSVAKPRLGAIELTDLPDRYCPVQAEAVVTYLSHNAPTNSYYPKVTVEQCRYIMLKNLFNPNGDSGAITLKLAQSPAFRVQIDSVKGNYRYAPSLGDVNDDNVIDLKDEAELIAALSADDPSLTARFDLDRDQEVTVLDLGLTRANQYAGTDRPDGGHWGNR